jgi:hypothetical protein
MEEPQTSPPLLGTGQGVTDLYHWRLAKRAWRKVRKAWDKTINAIARNAQKEEASTGGQPVQITGEPGGTRRKGWGAWSRNKKTLTILLASSLITTVEGQEGATGEAPTTTTSTTWTTLLLIMALTITLMTYAVKAQQPIKEEKDERPLTDKEDEGQREEGGEETTADHHNQQDLLASHLTDWVADTINSDRLGLTLTTGPNGLPIHDNRTRGPGRNRREAEGVWRLDHQGRLQDTGPHCTTQSEYLQYSGRVEGQENEITAYKYQSVFCRECSTYGPFATGIEPTCQEPGLDADDTDPDNQYEVRNILDHKHDGHGEAYFLVSWKEYDSSHNSWEPEGNISAPEAVEEFKRTQPPYYWRTPQGSEVSSSGVLNRRSPAMACYHSVRANYLHYCPLCTTDDIACMHCTPCSRLQHETPEGMDPETAESFAKTTHCALACPRSCFTKRVEGGQGPVVNHHHGPRPRNQHRAGRERSRPPRTGSSLAEPKTIDGRLDALKSAARAISRQLSVSRSQYHKIFGGANQASKDRFAHRSEKGPPRRLLGRYGKSRGIQDKAIGPQGNEEWVPEDEMADVD